MEIRLNNLRDDYSVIVDEVFHCGDVVSPRGQETLELLGVQLRIENPCDVLPVGVGRGLNLGIAAYEAAALIAGVSKPSLIGRIAPSFENFMDDGKLQGAYGPRAASGIFRAVQTLVADPSSRQAVATIWHTRDPIHRSKDVPCTTNLQWLIRDGALHAFTTMRSNDVWLGLAYDAFMFCQLQVTLAGILGVGVGRYYHHARSLHLYTRDLPAMSKLTPATRGPVVEVQQGFAPAESQPAIHGWWEATERARLALENHPLHFATDQWYAKQLHGGNA